MLAVPTSQKTRLLLATSGQVLSKKFDAGQRCRELTLRSVERKIGTLDQNAWSFKSFETNDGRLRTESFKSDGSDIWAMRFSEPDSTIAGRDWIVEAVSTVTPNSSHFSCRLSCFSRAGNFSFIPSTPGLLKDIAASMAFFNTGITFNEEIKAIEGPEDITKLLAELAFSDRWWNVIVVSESQDSLFGCDPKRFASDLMGVANVYYLPIVHYDDFDRLVGRDFRVFRGGVRTFRPKFDPTTSESLSHPVIASPLKSNESLVDRAHHVVGTDAFSASVKRSNYRLEAIGFFDVRQAATSERVRSTKSAVGDPQVRALEDALSAASEEGAAALELAGQAETDRNEAQQESEELRTRNFALSQRVLSLETALKSGTLEKEIQRPQSYDAIAKWVRSRLAGRLSLHTRAERSLKEAQYENIDHITDALLLLGNDYVDMRRGALPKAAFDNKRSSLGLDLSGSISASRAGEQGEEYFVRHGGNRVFIDLHLKKGTSFEARKSIRIYFFFDEDISEVVVCSLPGHLENRQT